MKKFLKWFLILFLAALVIIQFVRIDKTVPAYDAAGDFTAMNAPGSEGAQLLKNACYDCHSYETKYPWYAEIAPFSWLISHHIEEGREHVNFSTWASYSDEDKTEVIEESIEEIDEGKMPDPNYVRMHPEAEMTPDRKAILIDYLRQMSGSQGAVNTGSEDHEEDEEDE